MLKIRTKQLSLEYKGEGSQKLGSKLQKLKTVRNFSLFCKKKKKSSIADTNKESDGSDLKECHMNVVSMTFFFRYHNLLVLQLRLALKFLFCELHLICSSLKLNQIMRTSLWPMP